MDCLRSFLAVVELGGFSQAGDRVGRTAPAISLQMNRLQNQVGLPLFKKEGRCQVLTRTGHEVLEHAKAILSQNDAVLKIAQSNQISGVVRLGVVQDIAESFFPNGLADFSEQFPNIRVQVLVDRSPVLLAALERGELDQVIAFKQQTNIPSVELRSPSMIWIEKLGSDISAKRPLPIVMVEGPCRFRTEAFNALSHAGIPWEITLTSPSLACVAAAAEAGLGVTVRTQDLLKHRRPKLAHAHSLPKLPKHELHIYNGVETTNAAIDEIYDFWIQQFSTF
ncbi:LysR substrate-binding domain-containing protein [Leucothrix arctica]|nr:LysR substrate-binding domain-containing protein [Leucothrix arctica]